MTAAETGNEQDKCVGNVIACTQLLVLHAELIHVEIIVTASAFAYSPLSQHNLVFMFLPVQKVMKLVSVIVS